MTSFRSLLVTSVLLAGCNLDLKMQRGARSPAASVPARAGTPAARGKGGYSEAQLEDSYQRVVAAYRGMTWGDLQQDDADSLFSERAKPLHPPFFKISEWPSPDGEWIPGWGKLAALNRQDIAYQMLGQAAANRAWLADCQTDFARYATGWKALDVAIRPRLDAARREANPYARISKLLPLLEEVVRTGTEQKLFLPAAHPSRAAGLYFELVDAVSATYAASNALFHAGTTLGHLRADVALMQKYGRALRDEAFERDAYCGFGQKLGTAKWQPLPDRVSERDGAAYLRWPVPAARRQEVERELAKIRRGDHLKPMPPGRIPVLDQDSSSSHSSEPKLWSAHVFEVKRVQRQGDGLVLELERVRANNKSYDCITTNKVDRILPDGRVEYKQKCRMGDQEHRAHAVITFAVAPRNLDIRPKDRVHAYGDLVDKTHKVLVDRADQYKDLTRYKLAGRWIAGVERAGKMLVRW